MATSCETISKPSKIPKYLKSSLPFASTDYKKTLRGVREKKVVIEVKLGELKILKTELEDVTLSTPLTKTPFLAQETVSSSSSSAVRTVINTPGGTKRKGESITLLVCCSFC